MRPKSMATVVVFFCWTLEMLSTPSDTSVTRASVRSGSISETAPTKVVFPTPNPPATTIFVEALDRLEGAKSTECPFDEITAFISAGRFGQGCAGTQVAFGDEVSDEDP